MAKLNPAHKAKMVEAGTWRDFLKYRDDLVAGGAVPKIALGLGLAKFLGEEAAKNPYKHEKTAPVKVTGADGVTVYANAKPRRAKAVAANRADFANKEASEVEIIRWVARWMEVLDVTPAECPDAAAWALRNQCLENPVFKFEFWKTMYPKIIPSRGLLDGDGDKPAVDGVPQVEMIDKLLAAKLIAEVK